MDTYTERVAHATEGAEDTFVENQKEFSYQSLSKNIKLCILISAKVHNRLKCRKFNETRKPHKKNLALSMTYFQTF